MKDTSTPAVIPAGTDATAPPTYLSPVQCQRWCAEGDGHPDATIPEDQLCTSEAVTVPLSLPQTVGRSGHRHELTGCNVELVTDEVAGNQFTIHLDLDSQDRHDGSGMRVTPDEAEAIMLALRKMVDFAKDGRVERVLPADEWTARATSLLAEAASRGWDDYTMVLVVNTAGADVGALLNEIRPVLNRTAFTMYGPQQLVGIAHVASAVFGRALGQNAMRAVGRVSPAATVGHYTSLREDLATMLGHAFTNQTPVPTGSDASASPAVRQGGDRPSEATRVDTTLPGGFWSRAWRSLSGRRGR